MNDKRDSSRRGIVGRIRRLPLFFYAIFFFCIGMAMYVPGVVMVIPRRLFGLNEVLLPFNEWIVWYSGLPVMIGIVLVTADLFLFLDAKRRKGSVRFDAIGNPKVTVALTAYNDEESIAAAVSDFLSHPLVQRVIVVSNNSTDKTYQRAQEAAAIVFNEPSPGYGRCVYRCLSEACKFEDTDLVVLCEGDLTFRAQDLDKFLAYAPHADIVNGTRIVEQLREYNTQLSTFMYYGNFFVGKLLEVKHLGKGTFTDVGTTYKLCRRDVLGRLLPELNPAVNLEFNAHFLDTALEMDLILVECPITFHPRVGVSKGGNVNNPRAFKVGFRMILGLVFGWKG
jgi:glycosyltransferase involved in cell wall biosynthesis